MKSAPAFPGPPGRQGEPFANKPSSMALAKGRALLRLQLQVLPRLPMFG